MHVRSGGSEDSSAPPGEMAGRVRAFDWARTPLGPMRDWPASLRPVVDTVLASPLPMIVLWGPQLIQIYNDAHARLAGAKHPGALGAGNRETWPEAWAFNAPIYERVLRGGEGVLVEDQLIPVARNGAAEEAYFSVAFSPVRDDDGGIGGILAVVSETTGKVLAERERALRQSEARFRQLADTMPQIVWTAGANGEPDYYNRRWYDYTGVAYGDVGHEWRHVVHPDDVAATQAIFARAVAAGEGYSMELRLRRKSDGAYRWFLARAVPERDEAGRVTRWFGTSTDIHERKEAEDRARMAREQVELVVKGANVGVWYCPLPFDRLIWDEKVKEHFHLAPDAEVTIDTFYDRIHPDDREPTRAAIDASIRERREYSIDYRTVSPGGQSVKWIRAKGRAFFGPDGRPTRFDGVTIDVTENRLAQDALRRSEERFQAFMDHSPTASWITDADGRLEYVSGTYLRTFRLPTPDIVGKRPQDLYPVEFADEYTANIRAVAESGRALETVEAAPRPDGSLGQFLVYKFPITDAGGRKLVGGVAVDVTARRQAEAQLREAEERYRFLVDSMPQIVWTATPDGGQDFANRRWFEFTGIREGAMTPDVYHAICHPDDVEATERQWGEAIRTGRPYAVQHRIRSSDGTYRWILSRAVPQTDASGRIVRWFGTGTDVTELRQAQEALSAAKEEAERANRAKDQFLAVLSHELRTPLSPVLMTVTALERDLSLPTAIRDDLAVVRRNIELEARLIDDLLDLSRVLSGKLNMHVQPMSLHQVVRLALATCDADAQAKGVTLTTDLGADRDVISGDAARVQQVVWNLLKNAIKFTPEGGAVVVRTRREGDGTVRMEVADNGVGIPPEAVGRIFDPFEQAAPAPTPSAAGLGLGLAICKSIVELHGGTIRAASAGVGHGATFTVTLPIAAAPTAASVPVPDGAPGKAQSGSGLRLLLVEDHADTARVLSRLLRASGHRVQAAGSVADALALAASTEFDLLVSDVGLPDASGYDLMREVRTRYRLRGIAMTGYGMDEDHRLSREAGFAEHLVKPVNIALLEQAIRRVTGG